MVWHAVGPVAGREGRRAVAGVEVAAAGVEAAVAKVEADVAEVEADVAEVEADVAKIEADVAEVEVAVAEVEAAVAEVEAAVAEVEVAVAEVEADVAKVEGAVGRRTGAAWDPTHQKSAFNNRHSSFVNPTGFGDGLTIDDWGFLNFDLGRCGASQAGRQRTKGETTRASNCFASSSHWAAWISRF